MLNDQATSDLTQALSGLSGAPSGPTSATADLDLAGFERAALEAVGWRFDDPVPDAAGMRQAIEACGVLEGIRPHLQQGADDILGGRLQGGSRIGVGF